MQGDHDWKKLLLDARASEDGFTYLVQVLHPIFVSAARRVAPQCQEDAVQCALLKVWKQLDKFDEDRVETIRAVMVTTGVRAMRDEVRKVLRHKTEYSPEEPEHKKPIPPGLVDNELFQEYLGYIEETGSFHGAHSAVAKRLGISTTACMERFHAASEALAAKEGIERYRKVNSIFRKLMNGKLAGRR